MKIAVLGSTGFVGRYIVAALHAAGHDVTALVHRRPAEGVLAPRVRRVQASIDDADSLAGAFGGSEVVYHAVGIIVESGSKTYDRTVVRGTSNVVKACREAGVRKIVYVSAAGVTPGSPSRYMQTKAQAEEMIRESGLGWSILRPSLVYGPGDGFISMLAKMIRLSPILPIPGHGRHRLQPVFVEDLAAAAVAVVTDDRGIGRTIDITGPEILEYKAILTILRQIMRRRRLVVPIPMGLVRLGASLAEALLPVPPVTREQLMLLEMGSVGDNAPMRQLLGVEPRRLDDGLRTYMR